MSVARLIDRRVSDFTPPFDGFRDLAVICGLTHDLGKATREFQDYLMAPDDRKAALAGPMTNHARLSAVLSMVIAYPVTKVFWDRPEDWAFWTAVVGIAVAKHHADLPDVNEFLSGYLFELQDDRPEYDILHRLHLDGIRKWITTQMKDFQVPVRVPAFADWHDIVVEIDDFLLNFKDFTDSHRQRGLYAHINLLYSLLIGADKLDAALGGASPPALARLETGVVASYKADKFKGPGAGINELREQAARQVRANFDKAVARDVRLMTLTAPTGIGKTLMALDLGLDFAARNPAPLIYCLPFTSIIDQTFDVTAEVLNHAGLDREDQALLLKHHYLSPREFKGEDLDPDKQEILVEAWNSRVVITTFVQFFDTLFSGRNRAMKKLMQLPGAMVILDEVQGIPRKFWGLVRDTFQTLARDYGTRFLLMTATQPRILSDADGVVELLPGYQDYFKALSRVDLNIHIRDTITIEDLAEQVTQDVRNGKRRVIAIVNTVQDSLLLYEALSQTLGEDRLLYLSANIIPLDRRERVEALKKLDEWVLVTTQVVEAGVDISAEVVHRDMGPLDAIVQAAGRCNRNREQDKGMVHVWRVKREDTGRESAAYVYDKVLLGAARDALNGRVGNGEGVIPDHEFAGLVDEYFGFVKTRGAAAGANGRDVLEIMRDLDFGKLGEKVKLIEEVKTTQYFVIRQGDQKAQALWDEYQKIQNEPDFRTRHQRFMRIKADFFQRVISVRESGSGDEKKIQPLYQEHHKGAGGYNQDTGFVRSKDDMAGTGII